MAYLKYKNILILIVLSVLITLLYTCKSEEIDHEDFLKIEYSGDAIVEVGSPNAGIEFHHSCPVPQRISFYYPIANSLDLSPGYWERDSSFFLAMAIVSDEKKEWLNYKSFDYEHTPYKVKFYKCDAEKEIIISYDFAKNYAAVILNVEIINNSDSSKNYTFELLSELTLRTSHSYNIIDSAEYTLLNNYDVIFNYPSIETDFVNLFYLNCGETPSEVSFNSSLEDLKDRPFDWWLKSKSFDPSKTEQNPGIPSANYRYSKKLGIKDTLKITNIIGTCKNIETEGIIGELKSNYKDEILALKEDILNSSFESELLVTGDQVLDHSVYWAKSIIKSNRHYIDGYNPIMPCPAEYNFYFTHDMLLTDLAVVRYNPDQVKSDLEFIIRLSNEENIIPHAYYWKDSSYATEYSGYDNWNHFWFVILNASFLKHSGDKAFIEEIFPKIEKSISQVFDNEIIEGLVNSYRQDWWDAGKNFGPRAYMTILAFKTIKDYIYLLSSLNKNINKIPDLQQIEENLKSNLLKTLWSEKHKYLMNILENGELDEHYYMGSQLAVMFNMLDDVKSNLLMQTVKNELLDESIGIRNVVPMDIHELSDYYRLLPGEAGDVGIYFNGGVWPHANAFFVLSLINKGEKKEAYDFIKNIMTIKGIINSPNGQPAMYEYRNSNRGDIKNYGRIDKPDFTWAGGWYLYCLYEMLGARENDWNIFLDPYLSEDNNESKFDLFINGKKFGVNVCGSGKYVNSIKCGDEVLPTLVIPQRTMVGSTINIELGNSVGYPYLKHCNSKLENILYDKDKSDMIIELASSINSFIELRVISSKKVLSSQLNDDSIELQEEILEHGVQSFYVKERALEAKSVIYIKFEK